jgi:hypothetical protein
VCYYDRRCHGQRTNFHGSSCPSLFLQVSGVLDAPIGKVTICFMHMVGAAELKAWDAAEAAIALDIFSGIVEDEARRRHGYLVCCACMMIWPR